MALTRLDKGILSGWKKKSTTTPVVKYQDGKGVWRYKGTGDLKKTESLELNGIHILFGGVN